MLNGSVCELRKSVTAATVKRGEERSSAASLLLQRWKSMSGGGYAFPKMYNCCVVLGSGKERSCAVTVVQWENKAC